MQQAAMPPDDFGKRKKNAAFAAAKGLPFFSCLKSRLKKYGFPERSQSTGFSSDLQTASCAEASTRCASYRRSVLCPASGLCDAFRLPSPIFPIRTMQTACLHWKKLGVSVQVAHLEKINGVSFATLQISRQDTLKSKSMSINVYDTRTEEDDPNSYSADACTWIDMPFGVDTMVSDAGPVRKRKNGSGRERSVLFPLTDFGKATCAPITTFSMRKER